MACQSHSRPTYEVVVIGGGPAGCAAAVRLAAVGRRVLLVERRRFPRFHIGESMLPASNAALRALGLQERMRGADFVEKRGASFQTEDGEHSVYIDFSSCPRVPAPVTYQVERSRFDAMLLARAAEVGVEIREEHRVTEVAFESGGVELVVAGPGGRDDRVGAEVVLDASGQAGFLAKRLDLRRLDRKLRNVALYAHFEGVPRPPGERSGDIRVVSRRDLGWIWFIPLTDTVTSVGVVVSKEQHAARPSEPPEAVLDRYLAMTPVAAERMRGARRISAARYEADFSYMSRAYAGDRWLLAGDAGSFLDPVFSTGVLLALESGLEAAAAIEGAIAAGDVTAGAFAAFQRIQRRRYRYFRRFVRGFYDPAFRDLFFQPTTRWGLLDPIVASLAGDWRPSLVGRLKLGVFFALVAAQRFLPLAPKRHGCGAPRSRPADPSAVARA